MFMAIGAAVGVKQTAERVNADENVSTLTFTKACGGTGTADDGITWTITSDATESTYDSDKGVHYGTNSKAVSYLTLTSSSFSGKVTKVVANVSDASKAATISVTVGGKAFGENKTETAYNNSAYTFTPTVAQGDNFSGVVVVSLNKTSVKKALYCKSVAVTYVTSSGESDTLDAITDISATVSAKQGDNEWTIDNASAIGTVSGVSNKDVTNMVDFSVETDIPNNPGQVDVVLRATKKDSVEGDATYFEKTVSATVTENPFASFTKVTDADDVSSSCVYALSNDGNNFVGNTISNKGLIYPVTDIEDVGFFKLDANGGLQLVTNQNNTWSGAIDAFINNSSSTDLSLGTRSSVWEAKENSTSGVYLSNKSNSNRFLGLNKNVSTDATLAKAYAATNLNKDNIPVYLYEVYEDVSPLITLSAPRNYLMVGETGFTITAHKENFDENLTWETSNSNIATVSNGVVTPVNYGKVTITAKYGKQAEDSIDLVVYPNNTNTISIALALEICELTGNANSPYAYTVVGEVGEVAVTYSDEYHNMTFELIDENTDIITCYRAAGTHAVKEGTKVQVTGNLINFTKEATVTPEFASGSTYREFYTVRFFNGDEQYGADVEALEGEKLNKPTDPEKEDFAFVGWEDADGNMWNFDNDTVNGDIDLTSVWNNNAEASLQNDLDRIKPWMSLSYKYYDNMSTGSSQLRITDGDYYPHSGNDGITKNASYSLTSDFANDKGLLITLNTFDNNYLYINLYKGVDELRIYKTQQVVIESNKGDSIYNVVVVDTSGNSLNDKLTVTYADGKAFIKNESDSTVEKIAGFDVDFTSGGFTDGDFRIRMAVDDMAALAEKHEVTEYGVEISDGTTTKCFQFTEETHTVTDTNGTKQYVIIGLGDVFAHPERLQAVFSLKAYAVLNGKKLYSTNVKQHSVVSLVESYHAMESYSKLVDPLYQYFVSVGLVDED